jgi:hypothetical protein
MGSQERNLIALEQFDSSAIFLYVLKSTLFANERAWCSQLLRCNRIHTGVIPPDINLYIRIRSRGDAMPLNFFVGFKL